MFARVKKVTNPVDKHVGRRVRMRRMMLVQKYEKGTNRIGASRLQQISHILQVPITFFFEDAPTAQTPHGSNGSALSMAQIDDFVSDSIGLRLIEAFMRIDNAARGARS
jgi:transcriptional regulator with XRE-family HTH domain